MPSYKPCISCGKPRPVTASTAPGGPRCRNCRRHLCLGCGQPYPADHHGTPYCADCRPSAREQEAA